MSNLILDIIIPTYKDKDGLRRTLRSISPSLLSFATITIIDDCSDMYYNDILNEFPFVSIYYQLKNQGPGIARQFGIEITSCPYIMFIDTGDYFISNEIDIIKEIQRYNGASILSWPYKTENIISKNDDNHLHGKIYNRNFLKENNITFCTQSSYANEDIGFNRLCRLLLKQNNENIIYFNTPIIVYNYEADSLTNKNEREFFYRQQNISLALVTLHNINNPLLTTEVVTKEVNTIMSSIFYTFLCTLNERSEFVQDAWHGAKIFYDAIHNTYKINNFIVNDFIKRISHRRKKWINAKPINFSRFLSDLERYEKIPRWYV